MVNWNLINGLEGKFSAQDVRKNILSYIILNYPASQVEFIEKEVEVPIKVVSVGPDRKQTILK